MDITNKMKKIDAKEYIISLVFLDNRNLLSSGNEAGMIRQWNIEDGIQVGDGIEEKRLARVVVLAVSPNGEWIIGGGDCGCVVWKRNDDFQLEPYKSNLMGLGLGYLPSVFVVDVSPDSTKVAAGDEFGVSIWDISTGNRLVGPLRLEGRVVAIKFSPDGNRLATGASRYPMRIYELDFDNRGAESPVFKTIDSVRLQTLASIAWLANGQQIYVVSDGGRVKHIDAADWSVIQTGIMPWGGHDRENFAPTVVSKNERFIVSFSSYTISFWDIVTHQEIGQRIPFVGGNYPSIALSLDNKHLAISSEAGDIRIFNLDGIVPKYYLEETNDSIVRMMEKNETDLKEQIRSLGRQLTEKTSESDRLRKEKVVLEKENKSLVDEDQVYSDRLQKDNADLKNQIDLLHEELEAHQSQLDHAQKDKYELELQMRSLKGDLSAVKSRTDELQRQVTQLKGRLPIRVSRGWVRSLIFSEDGERILSGSEEGVRQWRIDEGTEIGERLTVGSPVQAIAFSEAGDWIVTGQRKGATVWDRTRRQNLLAVSAPNTWVTTVDVSPDATKFATGSSDKKAFIFDVNSPEPLVGPLEHDNYVVAVKFSPDGGRIATATWQRDSLRIYRVDSGVKLLDVKVSINSFPSTCVAWTRDSQHIFALSSNLLRDIDANTGAFLREWTIPGSTTNLYGSIALSADSTLLACFTGRSVSLWDTVTGAQIGTPFKHSSVLRSIALSMDSKYLAVGDENGQVTVHDLHDSISSS